MRRNIKEIISQMTLDEKAILCSGISLWRTKGIERFVIPSIVFRDGLHRLRKQKEGSDHLGSSESAPATCFLTSAGLACSWDRNLIEKVSVVIL